LTLAQTDCGRGKEPDCRGTITLQTTLHEVPSPLPESFYDYLPPDQVSPPQSPAQGPGTGDSKVKVTTASLSIAHINSICRVGSGV